MLDLVCVASVSAPPGGKGSLLESVSTALMLRHYSPRTRDAYVSWVRRFVLFHGRRHPNSMSAREVSAFLSHLATQKNVSAST